MKELKNLKSLNNKELLVVLPINKVEENLLNECAYSLANQKTPVDVLVFVNDLDDKSLKIVEKILKKPILTVSKQDEKGESIIENVESENGVNYIIISTEKNTYSKIFNEAFNYAIKNEYKFISPIEYDDVLDISWYKIALKYAEEKEDIHAFMPLIKENSNGTWIGFLNEAPWSEGMAEEAGFADLQLLLRYNCLSFTGGVYNVKALQEISDEDDEGCFKPIKESLKISVFHEFFLRMVYNDIKFYTVPRVGYEQRIDRQTEIVNRLSTKIPKNIGSLPEENGGMSMDELKFWVESAKKEYFFEYDRKNVYEKIEENIEAK